MSKQHFILDIVKRGAINGIAFTCLWSSWAYFVNSGHGHEAALKSAITQASFTIINAFLFSIVMEFMFSYSKGKQQQLVLAFLLPNSITTAVLYAVHWSRETPNIGATILPSIIVVAVFSLTYVLVIGPRKNQQNDKDHEVYPVTDQP